MMLPAAATVQEVAALIKGADQAIVSVELVDFFTKKEWTDQKALTFRYICRDDAKTMHKDQIDQIEQAVVSAVKQAGATVR